MLFSDPDQSVEKGSSDSDQSPDLCLIWLDHTLIRLSLQYFESDQPGTTLAYRSNQSVI